MTTEPADLSHIDGLGELFAGYGRGENSTEAFQDMQANRRYEKIWDTYPGVTGLIAAYIPTITSIRKNYALGAAD